MVRWSYINPSLLETLKSSTDYAYTHKRYTFKVFRTTTKFRKYKLGDTRFHRKKDIKRKRQSSTLSLNFIPLTWVKSYMLYKQFIRFFQVINLLPYVSFMSNVAIVPKYAPMIASNSSIISFSCKNTLLRKLFTNPKYPSPINNPFSEARNAGLVTHTINSLNESHPLGTGVLAYDRLNYNSLTLVDNNQVDWITPVINKSIYTMLKIYYEINILITYLNVR